LTPDFPRERTVAQRAAVHARHREKFFNIIERAPSENRDAGSAKNRQSSPSPNLVEGSPARLQDLPEDALARICSQFLSPADSDERSSIRSVALACKDMFLVFRTRKPLSWFLFVLRPDSGEALSRLVLAESSTEVVPDLCKAIGIGPTTSILARHLAEQLAGHDLEDSEISPILLGGACVVVAATRRDPASTSFAATHLPCVEIISVEHLANVLRVCLGRLTHLICIVRKVLAAELFLYCDEDLATNVDDDVQARCTSP
jgi:hypothetical protein